MNKTAPARPKVWEWTSKWVSVSWYACRWTDECMHACIHQMNECDLVRVCCMSVLCEWVSEWASLCVLMCESKFTHSSSSSEAEKFAFVIFIKINISEGSTIFNYFAEFANIFQLFFTHFRCVFIVWWSFLNLIVGILFYLLQIYHIIDKIPCIEIEQSEQNEKRIVKDRVNANTILGWFTCKIIQVKSNTHNGVFEVRLRFRFFFRFRVNRSIDWRIAFEQRQQQQQQKPKLKWNEAIFVQNHRIAYRFIFYCCFSVIYYVSRLKWLKANKEFAIYLLSLTSSLFFSSFDHLSLIGVFSLCFIRYKSNICPAVMQKDRKKRTKETIDWFIQNSWVFLWSSQMSSKKEVKMG